MSGSQFVRHLGASLCALAFAAPASAVVEYDHDVTSNVIYGTGNLTGGWAVDQNANLGIELGLRAHVRYDVVTNEPANIFNSDGLGTYTHAAGSPPSNPDRGRWNVDFSVNSNYNDSTGGNLGTLRYVLGIDHNPSQSTNFVEIDLFGGYFDHAFGTNATAQGGGTVAPLGDALAFGNLIANNNLAQNSWNMAFFPGLFPFDPGADATYTFTLSAFRSDELLAQSSIDVVVGAGGATVPVPATLALLVPGLLALGWQTRRRSNQSA